MDQIVFDVNSSFRVSLTDEDFTLSVIGIKKTDEEAVRVYLDNISYKQAQKLWRSLGNQINIYLREHQESRNRTRKAMELAKGMKRLSCRNEYFAPSNK